MLLLRMVLNTSNHATQRAGIHRVFTQVPMGSVSGLCQLIAEVEPDVCASSYHMDSTERELAGI